MAEIELDRESAKQGDLPDVCVYCGEPSITHSRKLFIGRSPFLMLAGAGLMQMRAPVCAAHRFASAWRIGLTAVLFLSWFGLLALVAWLDPKYTVPDWLAPLREYRGPLILIMLGLFVATIVWRAIAFYTDVRLTDVTWETITIAGVSEDFVDACYDPPPARTRPRHRGRAPDVEPMVPELIDDEEELEPPRKPRRPKR